jgi:hypothetical protein
MTSDMPGCTVHYGRMTNTKRTQSSYNVPGAKWCTVAVVVRRDGGCEVIPPADPSLDGKISLPRLRQTTKELPPVDLEWLLARSRVEH